MKITRTLKCILLTIMAMLIFLQPLTAGADGQTKPFVTLEDRTPKAEDGAGMEVSASSDSDNVVVQVIVNMVNQALEQPEDEDEWEDPSLKEYPLDPHELKEYGDSPRVRLLSPETEEKREDDEEEPGYLVYRDSLYLIPQEEAKQYTVTYSDDKRTATLIPSVPLSELEGKTGIVLLDSHVTLDEVLMFGGTPSDDGNGLKIPLARTEELRLNQLFSDGNFTTDIESSTDGTETTVTANEADGYLASAGGNLPARQKAGVIKDLLNFPVSVSGTNWSGEISHIWPTTPKLSFSINAWKLKFEIRLNFGLTAEFDITATAPSGGKEKKTLVSLPIELTEGVDLVLSYTFVAQFDQPMHVKGKMTNTMSCVLRPIGSMFEDFITRVEFTEFEVGTKTEGYFTKPDLYADKDLYCYLGTEAAGTVEFGKVKIDLGLKTIKIGPVFKLPLTFYSGSDVHALWERNQFDPATFDRTDASLHSCLKNGELGCLSINTIETSKYDLKLKINLYFKKWTINLYTNDSGIVGRKQYYRSLTHRGNVEEGICPHILYRVPVRTWDSWEMKEENAVSGMQVFPANLPRAVDETEEPFTSGVTDSGGSTAVYLPYKAKYRYDIAAIGQVGESTFTGLGTQSSDMKRGANDPVDIVVSPSEVRHIIVKKNWDADLDGNDAPSQIQVVLEQYENGNWTVCELNGRPAVGKLEPLNGWKCAFDVPVYRLETDGTVSLIGYRVRELDCNTPIDVSDYDTMTSEEQAALMQEIVRHIVYDPEDSDSNLSSMPGYVVYRVRSYLDRRNNLIPDHDTKYKVSYSNAETEAGTEIYITDTAVYDVNLYKRWIGIPEDERPDHVYLTLTGRIREDWADLPEAEGAFDVPVMVTDPTGGDTVTLAQMEEEGELAMTLPRALERGLAIVKASAENGWAGSLQVRKYRNGIPCDYYAEELDAEIIRGLLLYEYGVNIPVGMEAPGDWLTIPGAAHEVYFDFELTATVINTAVEPDEAEHTIGGMKYWRPNYGNNESYPEKITLQVYEVEEDGTLTEVGDAFDIPAPPESAGVLEKRMWPWVFTHPDIQPGKTYTVGERMPYDYRDRESYHTEVFGVDAVNTWIGDDLPVIRIKKITNREYYHIIDTCRIKVRLYEGNNPFGDWVYLNAANNYETEITLTASEWNQMNIDSCRVEEIVEEELPFSYSYITLYEGPDMSIEGGKLYYTFYIANMVQRPVEIEVAKIWNFPAGSEIWEKMPDRIGISLFRNGVLVNRLEADSGRAQEDAASGSVIHDFIHEDENNNPLKYLDEHGRPYSYTITEDRFDGMITPDETKQTEGFLPVYTDSGWRVDVHDYKATLAVTNTWIDPETENYVTVAGEKAWADDQGKEQFRQNRLVLSVVNSKDVRVRTFEAEADAAGNIRWSIPGLPRYDEDGAELGYYVIESQIPGYTAEYGEPVYDDNTHTWTCDVTNRLTGYYPLTVRKEIDGPTPEDPADQERFTFTLVRREDVPGTANEEYWDFPMPQGWTPSADPENTEGKYEWEIQGEGEETLEFLFTEEGLYLYEISEKAGTNDEWIYDTDPREVLITVVRNENGGMDITSYIDISKTEEGGEELDEEELDKILPETKAEEVVFTNASTKKGLTVKKEWEIDLKGDDKPKSIEVVIQKKTGDGDSEKWETVEKIELSEDNDWEKEVDVPEKDDNGKDYDYRVRELAGEEDFFDRMKGAFIDSVSGAGNFSDFWNSMKEEGEAYVKELAQDVKDAAEAGYDALKEKLAGDEDIEPDELFDQLAEKMKGKVEENQQNRRIVHDKDDKDRPEKEKDEHPSVVYEVEESTSLSGEKEDGHDTKYWVSYKYDKDSNTYTITNEAVMDVSVYKRWIKFNVDDEDMPDHVWLVLTNKLDSGMIDKISDYAGKLGIDLDLSSFTDIEIPVINPKEGGINLLDLASELALGFDLTDYDLFGLFDWVPKVAVTKVEHDEEKDWFHDWGTHYVVDKYPMGVPVEFKGAELSSEIIRQVIKYVFHVDLPVSFNIFDFYLTVPGEAYQIFQDYELTSNVINTKIGFDFDDDPPVIGGTKYWKNDKEGDRPEWIKIHITDKNGEELVVYKTEEEEDEDGNPVEREEAGRSPILLEKKDFKGSKAWVWSLAGFGIDEDEKYTITEEYPEGFDATKYTTQVKKYDIINTRNKTDRTEIVIRKEWGSAVSDAEKTPVTVNLYMGDDRIGAYELKEENDYQVVFATATDLPGIDMAKKQPGDFRIEEETVPDGMEAEYPDVSVTTRKEENGSVRVFNYTVLNDKKRTAADFSVTVKKVWAEDIETDEMPEKVHIILKRRAQGAGDDEWETVRELDLTGPEWQATVKASDVPELTRKDADGNDWEYTAEEEAIAGFEYTVMNTMDNDREIVIRVSNSRETTDVSVEKAWDDEDNNDGLRPQTVTVRLLADGAPVVATRTDLDEATGTVKETGEEATAVLSEENGWTWSFLNLPAAKNGQEIKYSAEEIPVPPYYTAAVTETQDGILITNTHEIITVSVAGKKIWDDDGDRDGLRPESVTFRLFANNEAATRTVIRVNPDTGYEEAVEEEITATLTEAGGWTYDFGELPAYRNGVELFYTVDEDPVAGYEKSVEATADGYDITNKHVPSVTDIEGKKIWDDGDDRDGIRPDSVTVILRANGTKYAEKTVTAENGWTFAFRNVPENANGKPIAWTVDEEPVSGYEKNINGYTITNKHIPGTVSVSGTKTWEDENDRDGIRPASVTVNLLKNGTKTDSLKTSADYGWKYSFANLPEKENGVSIIYTVEEEAVPGYETTIEGYDITNRHTPAVISIEGRKVWDDEDDRDGIRPDSVTVILRANGNKYAEKTVTAEDGWQFVFADVPENAGGKPIAYTVDEEPADG